MAPRIIKSVYIPLFSGNSLNPHFAKSVTDKPCYEAMFNYIAEKGAKETY